MKYKQIYDNIPFTIDPKREIDVNACCDCGLVHDIYYEIENNIIIIKKRRNQRSTGQIRRWMNKKQEGYLINREVMK